MSVTLISIYLSISDQRINHDECILYRSPFVPLFPWIKIVYPLSTAGVWSLRNVSISVPRAVLSGDGQAAVLRCSYDLEGAQLYSIRWYRAETEFYRFVPRELPPSMVFPLPGASVDVSKLNPMTDICAHLCT